MKTCFSHWALAWALALVTASAAAAQSAVTFTNDVAPIIFEHCAPCHRQGAIGPFSLLTYQDVRPRAAQIARVTRSRDMPPWKPEPGYGEFIGERRLTEQQIETIQRWAGGGAIEGNPSDLPPAPIFPDGWRLGTPDLIVSMAEPYVLPAGSQDVLRNFVMPVPVPGTRYVSGIEFRPGNARVVHHANIRVDRTRLSRLLDQSDPEAGYDGLVTTASFPDGHFLGWTPGQLPPLLADGMAWRLDPDSDLVVQLHMQPSDRREVIQSSVGLFFTDRPPALTPMMLRLGRHSIDIPAGQRNYLVEDSYVLPIDVEVHAVQPHAHFRAREVQGFATLPDGTRKWLLYIKDWDFNWQDVYRYAKPIALPKGTTIAMRYVYDNSADNRRNPDRPPRRVRWGEKSADEMGDFWLQVLPRTSEDRRILHADFGPKVLAEDAAGYEKMLEVEPDNARLREAAAAIYLTLQETERAIAHLQEALRINPASVEAHYNLATALLWQQRHDESIDHFRRALQVDPGHVGAHVNLAVVLRSLKRFDEAAAHLRRALQLDPRNPAAHTNLGGILAAEGRPVEAIDHYRLALQTNADLLEPLIDLAWILATSSNAVVRGPAEAVRLAERAVVLTNQKSVRALDTSAAAYAAAGQFDRAIETGRRAIDVAKAGGNAETIAALQARLELYRRKRAFYEAGRN